MRFIASSWSCSTFSTNTSIFLAWLASFNYPLFNRLTGNLSSPPFSVGNPYRISSRFLIFGSATESTRFAVKTFAHRCTAKKLPSFNFPLTVQRLVGIPAKKFSRSEEILHTYTFTTSLIDDCRVSTDIYKTFVNRKNPRGSSISKLCL